MKRFWLGWNITLIVYDAIYLYQRYLNRNFDVWFGAYAVLFVLLFIVTIWAYGKEKS